MAAGTDAASEAVAGGTRVKIGVCSANSGPYTTPDMLVRLSEVAEKTGVDSIWVSEHVVVPDPKQPPSNMDPGDPILDPRVRPRVADDDRLALAQPARQLLADRGDRERRDGRPTDGRPD